MSSTLGFVARHKHEAALSLRSRRRSLGLRRKVEEAPVLSAGNLLSSDLVVVSVSTFYFIAPGRWIRGRGVVGLFVIDDSQGIPDTTAAAAGMIKFWRIE